MRRLRRFELSSDASESVSSSLLWSGSPGGYGGCFDVPRRRLHDHLRRLQHRLAGHLLGRLPTEAAGFPARVSLALERALTRVPLAPSASRLSSMAAGPESSWARARSHRAAQLAQTHWALGCRWRSGALLSMATLLARQQRSAPPCSRLGSPRTRALPLARSRAPAETSPSRGARSAGKQRSPPLPRRHFAPGSHG